MEKNIENKKVYIKKTNTFVKKSDAEKAKDYRYKNNLAEREGPGRVDKRIKVRKPYSLRSENGIQESNNRQESPRTEGAVGLKKRIEQENKLGRDNRLDGKNDRTDWGHVAAWYDDHLSKGGDTYHEKVLLPNLLRLIGNLKGQKVLDLACGQGYFSHEWASQAKHVTGIDLAANLIKIAEKKQAKNEDYYIGPADNLEMLSDGSVDLITCVLALQNMEEINGVFAESARVLADNGRMYIVINHPSFRNPRQTHWIWDEDKSLQYRRVDEYISESKAKIDMNPGAEANGKTGDKNHTWSFHRPLQHYFKAINKSGLYVGKLEEWISHKVSQTGHRQAGEDKSRKEIPMFMCIEILKK